jgi:hypothetical protein
MSRAATIRASIPHSWTIQGWPRDVYPNCESRARYIFRMHKDSLLAAGAVCRVGRDLVFFGSNYQRWLEKKRGDVAGYEIAPNKAPPDDSGSDGSNGAKGRRAKVTAAPPEFRPRTVYAQPTFDSAPPGVPVIEPPPRKS